MEKEFHQNKRFLQNIKDDIPKTLESAEFFNGLRAGLMTTGFDEILAGEGPYTLFAPKDEAFMEENGGWECLLDPENEDALIEILSYHIINGTYRFTNGKKVVLETLHGGENGDISVEYDDILKINEKAFEATFPAAASNGKIYTIDSVLIPPGLEITCSDKNPSTPPFTVPVEVRKGPIFGAEPEYIDYIIVGSIAITCVLICYLFCRIFGSKNDSENVKDIPTVTTPEIRIERVEVAPTIPIFQRTKQVKEAPVVPPSKNIKRVEKAPITPRYQRTKRVEKAAIIPKPQVIEIVEEKPPTLWDNEIWN